MRSIFTFTRLYMKRLDNGVANTNTPNQRIGVLPAYQAKKTPPCHFIKYYCDRCNIKSSWQIRSDTTINDVITPENRWLFECETDECRGKWTRFEK